MSISMKNLSDRITALENKINSGALGGWEKGSNTNGNWIKEKTTGVIIQWGVIYKLSSYNGKIYFPIKFSTKPSVIGLGLADIDANRDGGTPVIREINLVFFRYNTGTTSSTSCSWIAIGYLISDRILNYIYNSVNASFVRIARFFMS